MVVAVGGMFPFSRHADGGWTVTGFICQATSFDMIFMAFVTNNIGLQIFLWFFFFSYFLANKQITARSCFLSSFGFTCVMMCAVFLLLEYTRPSA